MLPLPTTLLFMWICSGSEMNDHKNHKVNMMSDVWIRTVNFDRLYCPKIHSIFLNLAFFIVMLYYKVLVHSKK